jgi:cation diffusion facilitator family transporter
MAVWWGEAGMAGDLMAHTDDLSQRVHDHVFHASSDRAERSTRSVVWITAAMMVVEIAAGWWFNSMALLADGWHMSSHAIAIGLSAIAYATARRYAKDPRFAFGTWKVEILAGFASAILLLSVVVMMVAGSVERLVSPQPIAYGEAISVALLGLIVNIACALILGNAHDHGHGHDQGHDHQHGEHGHHRDHGHDHAHAGEDLNLKSAYMHVVADAATSVLAIIALAGGWLYGWSWLDPVMGIVGAVLVAVWARGLIIETGKVLLDREMDHPVVAEIRDVVESGNDGEGTRITDLHVWRVGKQVYSCALTIFTHDPCLTADDVRERLSVHAEIVHTTIEIHLCPHAKVAGDAAG